MFIEDIVELVNKFARFSVKEFRVEFYDNCLQVYTKDNLAFKTRAGKAIGPVFVHNDEFITHVNLDVHQFLADNKVYPEQYSYDEKKEDIRAIVREEIDKFVGENYRNRLSLVEATVREEIDKYLEAKFDGRIVLK